MADMSNDTCKLLFWRAGLLNNLDLTHDSTICLHHECLFASKFERKEMKCCDGISKAFKRERDFGDKNHSHLILKEHKKKIWIKVLNVRRSPQLSCTVCQSAGKSL